MGTFTVVSKAEYRARNRLGKEEQERLAEIKGCLAEMEQESIGEYVCAEGEEPKKIARLFSLAAKLSAQRIRVAIKENRITVSVKTGPPRPRAVKRTREAP